MNPSSSCQTFRNTLGKINIDSLAELFKDYVASPSEVTEKDVVESLTHLQQERSLFVEEYQKKARELLVNWHAKNPNSWKPLIAGKNFADSISFGTENQRVKIDGSLDFSNLDTLTYLPSLIQEVSGDFAALGNIPPLDLLEIVGGKMRLVYTGTKASLARLKKVGKDLEILGSSQHTLDSLETVGGNLASSTNIMPSLTEVGGNLKLDDLKRTSLSSLVKVGGNLEAKHIPSPFSLSRLKEVKGVLDLYGSDITSLPCLEKVGHFSPNLMLLAFLPSLKEAGFLNIRASKIASLPLLERVGDLQVCDNPQHFSIPALKIVTGNLVITNTNLASLPNLERVEGDIQIKVAPGPSDPQSPNIDVRSFFPKLTAVGKKGKNSKFYVTDKNVKRQVEELVEQGIIHLEGDVYISNITL